MDRLKTQNLHYKRVLDRQLSDIETRHRQSEQKRLREVRSLGLDLEKLHKSTRDVDEILVNSVTSPVSVENTPRTSTPRRASFSGSSPQTPRPLTSPSLTLGPRSSVTSSVAHLLSRSRQELTSVSQSPTPRASSRRHSVFDFRQQQEQHEDRTRKSSLPELKHSNSYDDNNIDNSHNNNNNNHSIDNCNNRDNGRNNTDNNNSGLSNYSNNNVCIDNNNIPGVVDNNVNGKTTRRPSIERRHTSADISGHVISVTIHSLDDNVSKRQPTSNTTANKYNKNNNRNSSRSSNDNTNTSSNNINSNRISNNNRNSSSSNSDKKISNNSKKTMTVGTERRGSNTSTTSADVKAQPARRRSSGNIGTSISTNNPKSTATNNSETIQDSSKTSMAGKSPTRQTNTRRGSTDSNSSSSSPTLKKRLQKLSITPPEEVSHNETVFLIHRDDDEPEVLTPENTSGAGSMFSGARRRRASEPALGGHLLRSLQNKLRDSEKERKTTPSNGNGGGCIPLKQAIEEELPSGIVAEEDEDRYNEEAEEIERNGARTGNGNADKSDGHKTSSSSEMSLSSSSSSISSPKATSTKKSPKDSNGKPKTQVRRKSDGDVLRFARIWRLHAGNAESLKGLFEDEEAKPTKSPPDTKDDIWEAVRKCRYIRGNDPIDQHIDLGDVFGHNTTESSMTTK